MLRKPSSLLSVVNFCQNFRNMASINVTKGKRTTDMPIPDENMTKRSKKKLRRYMHQHRLEKKTVSTEELKQLPNYCKENVNETDYYYQNGLRKVYPYYYSFSTYVKGRWMGRTILDVFTKEFHSHSQEYYKYNIEIGRVTVNGEKVSPDFILGNNQLIEHTCHRHENPIKNSELEILVDNDDVVVVNKPSSWPIHPCGRYRYNSVTHILQKEYGYKNLRGLYRLDRLTSGVFIMAKTAEFAAKVMKDIAGRNVQKEYVARVVGYFPDGIIECKEPLSCISFKLSVYRVDPKGKDCYTTFERLSYNGKTSIVKCMPHTGRTHQIRVHLQYLGHPIVNDNLYNSEAFGPSRGKGGVPENTDTVQLEKEILKHHNVGLFTESYENPVFLRKQVDRKERNLELPGEPQDKSKCDVLPSGQDESIDTSNNADKDMHSPDTKENELQVINDNKGEKIENSSVTANQKIEIVKEVYDFTGMTEEQIDDISDEPVQKRIKVDNENIKDEETGLLTCDLDSTMLENGNDSCLDGETALYNVEEVEDKISTTKEEPCDRDQMIEKHNDRTSTESNTSDVGTDSLDVEEKTAWKHKPIGAIIEEYNEEKMYELTDLCCQDCKTVYIDPKEEDLVMYLHAYRYKGSDWEYSTPLPDWANKDWKD